MAQLQRMDARLNTLSTELYQVNVCVGCIARRQATMGRFALEATLSPPPPMAFDSEDKDDDDDGDDFCTPSTFSLQLHHRVSCSVFVVFT